MQLETCETSGPKRGGELLSVRPVTIKPDAVDEERRRAVHSAPHATHEVSPDVLLERGVVQVALYLFGIGAGRHGIAAEVSVVERVPGVLLMFIDEIVH